MTAVLLNGKILAETLNQQLQVKIQALHGTGKVLKLVVILIGNNPASEIYVKNKMLACQKLGIACEICRFDNDVKEEELATIIAELNRNDAVHGILLQLPLPQHLNAHQIIEHIDPRKDVDGFHSSNLGLLSIGHARLKACTASGIIQLLEAYDIRLAGKDVLVIGLSRIVGLPLALELMSRHATVTCAHKQTQHLDQKVRLADIVISATGQRHIIQTKDLRPDHILIDVGIHYLDGKICGDIDFPAASEIVQAITPVPGGVGPMTISSLMQNIWLAYQLQQN